MKLKELLWEMSLPTVDNVQTATAMIQKAAAAASSGQPNQDVVGGLEASLKWLMEQPGLGRDPDLTTLKNKALAAKKRLDTFRASKATQQNQFSGVNPKTGPWGATGMKEDSDMRSEFDRIRGRIDAGRGKSSRRYAPSKKPKIEKTWRVGKLSGPKMISDPNLGKK
jgi:hypothetical protein